ncbi:putative membrane protein [Tranquillimonas rosea]|uniref:Putative membrane protein n=1 Tax=Tranquillimonas rosea TaxID=641238 RepID=A0A1H9RQ70_9RHOB|nr:cytochrome c oxidase assembly protein [Tranquillimonas rosea]SER74950.1 putative membrane protein [Tranquillimonas rosea]
MLTAPRLSGLALLAALWGYAAASGGLTMSEHMVIHLGVVAVVPALLDPPPLALSGPVALGLAVVAEMVVVWSWHLPQAHAFAATGPGLVLEQLSYLAVGLVLWAAVRGAGVLGGTAVLLGTVMHMTLLGALIGLAPRLIYSPELLCGLPAGPTGPVTGDAAFLVEQQVTGRFGLTALQQQQLSGAIMAGIGGLIYLVAALARLRGSLVLKEDVL